MLFSLDVKHHTAYVGFMNRSHHLCHYRETCATNKSQHLVFIGRHKFLNYGDAGSMQQCLYIMGLNISIFGDRVYNTTNTRHIHTKEFDLIGGRPGSIHNARQCGTQCHFVSKVHMAFSKESGNFRSGSIDGGKNGKDRFTACLHLLVQHVIHLEHGNQSRCPEDSQNSINIIEFLFTIFQAKTQMVGSSRSQDINRISYSCTGEEFTFQFVHNRAFQLGHIQSAFTQRISQHNARTSGMGNDGKILPF